MARLPRLTRIVLFVADVPRAGTFFNTLGLATKPFRDSSLLVDGVSPPLALTQSQGGGGPPQQGAVALCFAVPNLHSLLPRLLNECGAELEGGVEFDAQRGAVATVKHGGVFFTLTEEDG